MRGIPWIDIQLMFADMPFHDYSKKEEGEEEVIEVTSLEQHNELMKRKSRK